MVRLSRRVTVPSARLAADSSAAMAKGARTPKVPATPPISGPTMNPMPKAAPR